MSLDIYSDIKTCHPCGCTWQEDVQAAEESVGRPRRVRRSATKSAMVKLNAPKAVGLPKPPQIPPKVRETMHVCQFGSTPFACESIDMKNCTCAQCMYDAI